MFVELGDYKNKISSNRIKREAFFLKKVSPYEKDKQARLVLLKNFSAHTKFIEKQNKKAEELLHKNAAEIGLNQQPNDLLELNRILNGEQPFTFIENQFNGTENNQISLLNRTNS